MDEISLDEFQKILACVVGRAESADGLIRAEWTTGNGLRLLHIDPRAKERGLDALADAVMTVSNLALEDLQAQIRRISETVKNTDGAAPETAPPPHDADVTLRRGSSIGAGAQAPRQSGDHYRRGDEM